MVNSKTRKPKYSVNVRKDVQCHNVNGAKENYRTNINISGYVYI